MRFEQFSDKHKKLKLKEDEIVRKWKMQMLDEEQRLFEDAARRLQGQSVSAPMIGGGQPVSTGAAQLMVLKGRDEEFFDYYIFNYEKGTVSGPHSTGVPTANFEFGWSWQYIVNKSGFLHVFRNGSNDYVLMFVGVNGTIIDTIYGNTGDLSVDSYDGKYIVGWDYDGKTVWVFDGTKVITDTTTFIDVDNYGIHSNWDATTTDGVLMYSNTDLGDGNYNHKYYLATAQGITEIFSENAPSEIDYIDRCRFESNKILIYNYNNNTGYYTGFRIIDTTGLVLQNVEFTENTINDLTLERFGSDKLFMIFLSSSDFTIYVYNSSTDTLVDTTLSRDNYSNYNTYYSYKSSGSFSDADFSENCLLVFSTPTGNSNNYLDEMSYCKFVGYFDSENDFVISDYADNELKYIWLTGIYTPSVFMMPIDVEGAFTMLKFDSTGVFSYEDLNTSSIYHDNINTFRTGRRVFFAFRNTDLNSNNIYMINESASQFTLLEESIEGFYYNYDYDVVIVRDYNNLLAWYNNSISNGWISTDYYNDYNDADIYTSSTRLSNGVLIGFGADRIYYFNDMPDDGDYQTYSCDIIAEDTTITIESTGSLSAGLEVSGEGIPAGARIINILDEYSFEISVAATLTGTYTLNFRTVDYIDDGGDDMYDTGNELATDLGPIKYTHTQMTIDDGYSEAQIGDFIMDGRVVAGTEVDFGLSSNYFTNLYPGLFVLSASNIDITSFSISGDIGADGSGQQDNYEYTPTGYSSNYTAYIKRVWDAGDPSINQIFIVNTDGTGITHTPFDSFNNDDNNLIEGLDSVTKFHYLLFAKSNGSFATNEEVENIINSYLTLVDNKTISASLTVLNSNYSIITANLPSPLSQVIEIYKKDSVSSTTINQFENIRLGKSVFAYWYYDSQREGKITLKMYNYGGTLLRTIETNDELEDQFYVVENSVYLSTYTKYFDGEVYYIYNFNHACPSGTRTITQTLPDETNHRWNINDWAWWAD